MSDILFRCSSLGKIMTDPVSIDDSMRTPEVEAILAKKTDKRTDDEKALIRLLKQRTLSETAKTYIRQLVAQELFGVEFEVSGKAIEKGLIVELDSLGVLNRVRGLSLVKNTERRDDGFITGECDVFDEERRHGYDLKSSWSFATFPIIASDATDKDYEWQCRGYMRLWDAEEWTVAYALVNTPDNLIGYEPQSLHFVDHVPEHHRLTTWTVKRDREKEALLNERIVAARAYFREVAATFDREHGASGGSIRPAEPAPHRIATPAAPDQRYLATRDLLNHIATAYRCRFPTQPKVSQEFWADLRKHAERVESVVFGNA